MRLIREKHLNDPDVYKAAKIAAVKAGVTLRELILDCVRPRVM